MAASMAAAQQRLSFGAKKATCEPAALARSAQITVSAKLIGAVPLHAVKSCVPSLAGARG